MVIDNLVDNLQASNISKASFKGELYRARDILLLKPQTYMNLSGESLLSVANFYKIDLADISVIHDDIDIPFGSVRFKRGGSSGGHNGLKSIDKLCGVEYNRVRAGVGRPQHKSMDVAKFVLSDFNTDEKEHLEEMIAHLATASVALAKKGLEGVTSQYSIKKPKLSSC